MAEDGFVLHLNVRLSVDCSAGSRFVPSGSRTRGITITLDMDVDAGHASSLVAGGYMA